MWPKPDGDFPVALWPAERLRTVTNNPTGWLTIAEYFFTENIHGGTGCVLIDPAHSAAALSDTSWVGRDLGEVTIWGTGEFEDGLAVADRGVAAEFFVQANKPVGASVPTIEVRHPFLWYWDAFPIKNEWRYLNRAGRDQDLIRWQVTEDSWKVEVRTLEFRQFLAASGRSAVVQIDYTTKINGDDFERFDDGFRRDWAYFEFFATHERSMGARPAFSGIHGQYVITGLRNSRVPRMEEREQEQDYPTFIYGIDTETGHPLTHTSDPDKLGTYYDKDSTRLHYLTPIYFKREVLQPYASEPTRYQLSSSRLSCLNLWGVEISFNSIGLVEVYLGDLGRRLPSDEWGHWRTYNVPPEGAMDEGRFRRDFLNQWAKSKDVVGDLRRARDEAAAVSTELLGAPIWRQLNGDIKAEFDSLIGPLAEGRTSLGPALLTLTKVLVDAIDTAALKPYVKTAEKGDQSIRLLQKYADQLGDTSDITAILRELQSFRSKGGVAHLAGSQSDRAAAALRIDGLSSMEAFESVAVRATECILAIKDLSSKEIARVEAEAPDENTDGP
jgi:hypothetical protein